MEGERIVIIGGGIIGCATAYMIKRSSPGTQVIILEKNPSLAQECSYQNGGVFSYSFHHPWNASLMYAGCLKNIGNSEGYLKITSSALLDPNFWLWSLRFLVSSYFGYAARDQNIFDLGKRSTELHKVFRSDLISTFGKNFEEYLGTDLGVLEIVGSIPEFQKAKLNGLKMNQTSQETVHIRDTRESCKRIEPSIGEWKCEIVGCIKNYAELFAGHDAHLLSKNLFLLSQQKGAIVEYDAEVSDFCVKGDKLMSVQLKNGKTIVGDKFILCTGVGSREAGAKLGWTPPIWPVKGYSFNLKSSFQPKHALHFSGESPYWIVPLQNGLRVSGMMEFTGLEDKQVDPDRIKVIQDFMTRTFKITDGVAEGYWACQRPVTSDNLPIIGKFPGYQNVYINSGHDGRGLIFSFGSAEIIAHLISNVSPITNPEPFSPNRFYF